MKSSRLKLKKNEVFDNKLSLMINELQKNFPNNSQKSTLPIKEKTNKKSKSYHDNKNKKIIYNNTVLSESEDSSEDINKKIRFIFNKFSIKILINI